MPHKTRRAQPEPARTLIIHRNPQVQRLLEAALVNAGFEVFPAMDRADGFSLMYQVRPDIILLEAMQRVHETLETFTRLRLFTDTPTILICDGLVPSDYRSLSASNTLVLSWPIPVSKMVAVVKRMLAMPSLPTSHIQKPASEDAVPPSSELSRDELQLIDDALDEIGELGTLRLIFRDGRLEHLEKVKTLVVPAPSSDLQQESSRE